MITLSPEYVADVRTRYHDLKRERYFAKDIEGKSYIEFLLNILKVNYPKELYKVF